MTKNLSYNIISIFIIVVIILCLMNRDKKCKEYFNTNQDNIPIIVLGSDFGPFVNGIIDVEKIISI